MEFRASRAALKAGGRGATMASRCAPGAVAAAVTTAAARAATALS